MVRPPCHRRPDPFIIAEGSLPAYNLHTYLADILSISTFCILRSSADTLRLSGGVQLNTLDNAGSNVMSNFRQQLFHQFASQGLAASIDAFNTQYQPKKENRFNVDGITYEIGPARLDGDSITFEISSKIPQDELDDREDFASYFSAIQDFLKEDAKQPVASDMENIVQDVGGEETKERDYVRLRYSYLFHEMYSDAAITAAIARFQQDPEAHPVPDITNVNTLAGRVVLVCVGDFMQQEATTRMQRLIEANQEVRQTFGRHLTAGAGGTVSA